MTKQTVVGSSLILVAGVMLLLNISDTIIDLQTWHGLTTPAVVGAIMKQVATVALSALGGTLMPGVGSASQDTQHLTVDITKVGKL